MNVNVSKLAEPVYCSDTRTITVPPVRCFYDLIVVLHETGHYICDHSYGSYFVKNGYGYEEKLSVTRQEQMDMEVEAWQYVFKCVKPKYWARVIDLLKYEVRHGQVYKEI